jgi:hypothetical protein
MKPLLPRPATAQGLFVWVLHRFAEAFEEHAVLKGGIALALHDCPRTTTEIDYVFVPFESKKEVVDRLRELLQEIEGAHVKVEVHSKRIRAELRVDDAAIQIEANVDLECPSVALPTAGLARAQGQPSRLVRVMRLDRALAHKIAAWNERRLLRDLYDIYYLVARLDIRPDMNALRARLARIESRRPELRRRKSMTVQELATALETAAQELDEARLANELAPILPVVELEGLIPRLRGGVVKLVEHLRATDRA